MKRIKELSSYAVCDKCDYEQPIREQVSYGKEVNQIYITDWYPLGWSTYLVGNEQKDLCQTCTIAKVLLENP